MRISTFVIMTLVVTGPSLGTAQGETSGSGSFTISVTDLAPYTSPFIGISSTGFNVAPCPAGKMVVGVGGTKLKFVQKLTPLCASFDKMGSFLNLTAVDPAAIPDGGSGFTLKCPAGRVVTRLAVSYNENTTVYPYLGGVQIGCGGWFGGNVDPTLQLISTTGFDAWARKATVACTSSLQPVRSIRVRSTTSTKALSIVCDEP